MWGNQGAVQGGAFRTTSVAACVSQCVAVCCSVWQCVAVSGGTNGESFQSHCVEAFKHTNMQTHQNTQSQNT